MTRHTIIRVAALAAVVLSSAAVTACDDPARSDEYEHPSSPQRPIIADTHGPGVTPDTTSSRIQ